MKYLMSWTYRVGGTEKENDETLRRGLALYSKWAPSQSTTIHQMVERVDNTGGFSIIETDDPMDLAEATAKFSTIAEYTILPVLDIEDGVRALLQGVEFRESARQ